MSKTEIRSWVTSLPEALDDNEDQATVNAFQWDRLHELWPEFLTYARSQLLTSKTKLRVDFLEKRLCPLVLRGELEPSQILDIFDLLTLTYPRYIDSASRAAVENTLRYLVLYRYPEGILPDDGGNNVQSKILGWLDAETSRLGTEVSLSGSAAPANEFVLLNWACTIYMALFKKCEILDVPETLRTLARILALMLDALLDEASHVKPAMRRGAIVRVRRTVRANSRIIQYFISAQLSAAMAFSTPLIIAPLMGLTIDVVIHLKPRPGQPPSLYKDVVDPIKTDIIKFYCDHMLMSKRPVPHHASAAFNGFIAAFVTEEDMKNQLFPIIEKAFLRFPENAISVITDLMAAYSGLLTMEALSKLLNSILNGVKSTNSLVRLHSRRLFSVLVGREQGISPNVSKAVTEILALLKANKTAGLDHRIALYEMLQSVDANNDLALQLCDTIPALIIKEMNSLATNMLAHILSSQLTYLLRNNVTLQSNTVAFISREMSSAKPTIRRDFCNIAGKALWDLNNTRTEAAQAFASSLMDAFENCLKTASSNPLNLAAGPLEGYVALAALLRPIAGLGIPDYDTLLSRNAIIQSILTTTVTKPHFLLWPKCYQKLTTLEEEQWLLRALDAVITHFSAEVESSETLRAQFGAAFVYVATESKNLETRKSCISTLQLLTTQCPRLPNILVHDALTQKCSKSTSSDIEEGNGTVLRSRLNTILVASIGMHNDTPLSIREENVVRSIILAHHAAICGYSRSVWIELCQQVQINPHDLITRKIDDIMLQIWRALDASINSPSVVDAGYGAVTTLVFIAPTLVLPLLLEQIHHDLDPAVVNKISMDEYSIWRTPAGTLFFDVLSKKPEVSVAKGKDAELQKWEAELRKSLATKKPARVDNISKQDKALVEAQLTKESQIRDRVTRIKTDAERGLKLINSILKTAPPEFNVMLPRIMTLLISGAIKHGAILLGAAAFETYVSLADVCSERLGSFRRWIGITTLRSFDADGIPDELKMEPMSELILRVLYRLRSHAEQAPLDATTFTYSNPLISHVITTGAKHAANSEEVLEQLSISLDFIRFHCGEFTDKAYPRRDTLNNLIHIIRFYPQLAQTSVPSLVNLGEAIQLSATREEIDILIKGTLSQEVFVRIGCLQTLQAFDLTDIDWSPELWIACHDDDERCSTLAHNIWDGNGFDVPEDYIKDLLPLLGHDYAYVRSSCAYALAEAAAVWPASTSRVVVSLQDFFQEKAKILAPEFDEFGMVIAATLERTDPWPARLAIARSFEALAPLFPGDAVPSFFRFLLSNEVLGDRHEYVRRGLLDAGLAVLDLHGPGKLMELISMFEENLQTSSTSETEDFVKEAVVVLLGRLARHLDKSDSRIPKVVDKLVDALATPAESVQFAVSDCLGPLVKMMKSDTSKLIDALFHDMLNANKYAVRRGAAYGLAGVVKGLGISTIKEFRIIPRLREPFETKEKDRARDKDSKEARSKAREGAMIAIETFSATLGRLFEPYIPQLVPYLLTSFGDTELRVREATQAAAKVIMGNLSAYGVKLLLPSLLSGLEESNWRTKKGSIDLLGSMAFCAPTQLSLSLPTIIPRLTGVLIDSSSQVETAAKRSLEQFGGVISNPEIQSLVSVLLRALAHPEKAPAALNALLKTSFAHYIDSSSLALVMPIIERGLRERSSDTKRKAARIVGNMSSLTDAKDFVPYLSRLLPLVHVCLVDPVPEARATAAKALGTLVERLGEVHFPDLVPGLLRTLKAETSGVDRQGAAQGLSEVLAGLGMERMEGLLPDIIMNASSPRSHVKEGFMSLLVFLPATFGVRFQPHLPKIIQPILGGLADSEEVVREAALKAGRMIIVNHSHRAIDLLLPELEQGMFDSSWRIRQSSVTLVGELLFKLAGISGKNVADEEELADAAAADNSRRMLTDTLGHDRRDRILSSLYVVRQDGVSTVRQASIHVWKALVQNTPRTVREIIGTITDQILSLIIRPGFEQQETAARTVAELCRKFGEKLLAELLAILHTKSLSSDNQTREGVCLALSEILENTTEGQREGHEDELISMVRRALVDDASNVRTAAARAFDMLQEALGAKAIDETIPTLLGSLRQPGESSATALQALREVMNVRANVVFPILIPTLIAKPISIFNARALSSLVTVAGGALYKRLNDILEALVSSLEAELDDDLRSAIDEAVRALLGSISEDDGQHVLMMLLLRWAKDTRPARRISAMRLLAVFCEETELDITCRPEWIRCLLASLDDRQLAVAEETWKALDVFVKTISKEELESLVIPLQRTLESTGVAGLDVPGLSLPKGPQPLIPIILAGLLSGTHEQQEHAASAIGNLTVRTNEQAIKPFVVPLTGALIRVATQSATHPPPVKIAILSALTTMLEKIPQFVKPFFPQLQRTFVKAASDPSSFGVRTKAATALGALMASQPRVDPLVTELVSGAKSNEEGIAASLVLALANVAKSASKNLSDASKSAALELIMDAFRENHDEHYVQAIASLFANLAAFPELLRPIVQPHLIEAGPSMLTSHIIRSCIKDAPEIFYTLSCVPAIVNKIQLSIAENPSISRPAREAKELMKVTHPYADDNDIQL